MSKSVICKTKEKYKKLFEDDNTLYPSISNLKAIEEIGKMKTDYESREQTQIENEKGQMLPVVNLQFDVLPSVPQNLYNYLEA